MTRSKSSDFTRSSALDSSAERPGVQALASLHCWEGNVHVALKSDRVHFLFCKSSAYPSCGKEEFISRKVFKYGHLTEERS
jgi:hypothetical protein